MFVGQTMYPIFLKIENQPCLVVGGGKVATRKIGDLVEEGAKVTVVAQEASEEISEWARTGALSLEKREFRRGDTKGFFLVIAATNDHELNRIISREAGKTVLFNSVDEPDLCNFYAGAVVKRGKLRIAISSSGAFPSLTKKLKRDIDDFIPLSYERLIDRLGEFRGNFLAKEMPEDERKRIIDRIAGSPAIDEFLRGNEEPLDRELGKCV
jgi:precorrin-2 dehydrogenase / sirohydrochlorin ferrochelatase